MALPSTEYDFVVLGSSLPTSVISAALSSASTILHLSPQPFYGSQWASLSLPELITWSHSSHPRVRDISMSSSAVPDNMKSKRYALSLSPSIIPSLSPLIKVLIDSGVSKYSGFRQLDGGIWCYIDDGWTKVPMAKEEVFEDTKLSNIERRRVTRFLGWLMGVDLMGVMLQGRKRETSEEARVRLENDDHVSGRETTSFLSFLESDFSLSSNLARSIAYSTTVNFSPSAPLLPSLLKLHHHLSSIGIYGSIPSPFLIGNYGGIGELVEGFSRVAAVEGAIQVLDARWSLDVKSFNDDGTIDVVVELPATIGSDKKEKVIVKANRIVADEELLVDVDLDSSPSNPLKLARAIVIVDIPVKPTGVEGNEDSALFVFPPDDAQDGFATTALIQGESTFASPAGDYVVYLERPFSASLTSEQVLAPFISRLLPLNTKPLFTAFYTLIPPPDKRSMPDKIVTVKSYPSPEELMGIADTSGWAVAEVNRVWNNLKSYVEREDLFVKKEREDDGEEEM